MGALYCRRFVFVRLITIWRLQRLGDFLVLVRYLHALNYLLTYCEVISWTSAYRRPVWQAERSEVPHHFVRSWSALRTVFRGRCESNDDVDWMWWIYSWVGAEVSSDNNVSEKPCTAREDKSIVKFEPKRFLAQIKGVPMSIQNTPPDHIWNWAYQKTLLTKLCLWIGWSVS